MKLIKILLLFILLFNINIILEAKNKHKVNKKQNISQSLEKLKEYLPEIVLNNNEIEPLSTFLIEADPNSIFFDEENKINLINKINDWLGTPYLRGGRSKNGIDCSNFTSQIINLVLDLKFPSSPVAQTQAKNIEIIYNLDDLKFGDLIFFTGRNRNSNRIGHVGFYLGNGLFAHSSSSKGVIYTHISEAYYSERYRFGGRLVNNEILIIENSKK